MHGRGIVLIARRACEDSVGFEDAHFKVEEDRIDPYLKEHSLAETTVGNIARVRALGTLGETMGREAAPNTEALSMISEGFGGFGLVHREKSIRRNPAAEKAARRRTTPKPCAFGRLAKGELSGLDRPPWQV